MKHNSNIRWYLMAAFTILVMGKEGGVQWLYHAAFINDTNCCAVWHDGNGWFGWLSEMNECANQFWEMAKGLCCTSFCVYGHLQSFVLVNLIFVISDNYRTSREKLMPVVQLRNITRDYSSGRKWLWRCSLASNWFWSIISPWHATLHYLRPRVANGCSITHVWVEINGQRMGKTTTYEEETKTGNISALLLPLPFSWLSRKATS